MGLTDATYPVAARLTSGTLTKKNIYSNTFAYTETQKKVAAGTSTAVLAATTGATAAQTVTTGITNPDVPRALSVTPTVNAIGQPFSVVVTGVNIEGKPMTESFVVPASSTSAVNGVKAFKRVTSVTIPANTNGLTITVGTQNVLGLNHRLFKNNTTVKVYSATGLSVSGYTAFTLQGAPTIVANERDVELNTIVPATTPNGSTFYIVCYAYDNWALAPFQDQPEYSTTTSTSSTSSSTSTTTITTSTSSTSVSTSSTSSSSTSQSTSTSSTSTSTTTTP